jgi:hypothetical protein
MGAPVKAIPRPADADFLPLAAGAAAGQDKDPDLDPDRDPPAWPAAAAWRAAGAEPSPTFSTASLGSCGTYAQSVGMRQLGAVRELDPDIVLATPVGVWCVKNETFWYDPRP